jgi:uncharacterized membrane protein YgcG
MSRRIIIPFGLVQSVMIVVTIITARVLVYCMNPLAKNGPAWIGCIVFGVVGGSILAKGIANVWPETAADGATADRRVFWGGFSIEISADSSGDAGGGGGDGGGGDGGGGE